MKKDIVGFVTHLRLPFQFGLAPFYLLGLYLAGVPPRVAWILPFLAVHIGLYGGATVLNSYYDKDEGPIGMLKRPPPVTRGMLVASVVLQMASIVVICLQGRWAGIVAACMFIMSLAYSHPRLRLKGSTVGGLVTVAIGQGALAVLLGFFAAGATQPGPRIWLAALATSVLVLGFYPLTQIYQIIEDGRRGDRTLPVWLGWQGAMIYSGLVTGLGLLLVGLVLGRDLGGDFWPWILVAALAGLGAYLFDWGRHFERLGPYGNHDRAVGLLLGVSGPLAALLLYSLLANG